MSSFVLVIHGVTAQQLEKILEIQTRSNDKLRWFPQTVNNNGVQSQAFLATVQTIPVPNQPPRQIATYNNLRLEWDDTAASFAREVLDLFTQERKLAQAG